MIAQENLRKQKMARYGFANSKANVVQQSDSESAANKVAVAAEPKPEEKAITVLKRATPCAAASEKSEDFEAGKDGHHHRATVEELGSRTPILLLKPSTSDGQQPLFGLPKVNRDGNMSRFLQEVREMLQKELKANATTELNTITCWGTEATQISRDLAKQAKQTVAKDHGKRLFRSESFRGFRSDRKRKEATTKNASPEHVRIVARNILAHRLKSVTSITETVSSPNKDDEESLSSCSIASRERVRSLADVSPSGIDDGLGEQSFRSECLMKHKDDRVSPARALFRSFSAPELGFSIGRLFGDGSVRSATHEASDIASEGAASMTSKRNATLGFIRGTVSSLRNSFSLRRNLFRRRTHWSKKTSLGELHPQMAIGTTPSPPEAFNLFKVAQASKCHHYILLGRSSDTVSPRENGLIEILLLLACC